MPTTTRRLALTCLALAASFLLLAKPASGQETRGSITGRVLDASGAVIPLTEVTALHQATNTRTSATSNTQGIYLLPYLLPGIYRVSARLSGFKTFERDNLELRINDQIQLDIQMEVGELAERVTVTAETPLLQTANASLGQVIDARRLTDLPVLHSNPMLLLQLSPAAVSVATNMDFGDTRSGDNARLTEYAIAGTPASTHEVTLDGASNTTTSGGTSSKQRTIAFTPPSDVVSEFKVETAPFDASVANAPGGVINISLKSGTNDFHGSARYFKTNPGWNANTFFANRYGRPRTYLKNDHWVLSGSGPIVVPKLYNGRDRTFFMYGWERQKDDDPWGGGTYSVPTPKMRQGDFSDLLRIGAQYAIYDPATAKLEANRVTRTPFPGNLVPSNRFSPIARKILEYYPQPRTAGLVDGTQNYPYPDLLEHMKLWSHTGRIDHAISDKQRMFFRAYWGEKEEAYRDYYENLSTGVYGLFRNRGVGVDEVYSFAPHLVMNLRYSYTRFIFPHDPKSRGMDLSTLGFPASLVSQLDPSGTSFPSIGVSGLSSIGGEKPDGMHTNTHHMSGNLNWIKGRHVIKYGADYRVYQENYYRFGHAAPAFSFGTSWTSGPLDNSPASPGGVGQGFATFLLGLPTSGYVDRNASYAVQSNMLGLYLHDDWRVSGKLTVNVGLRYEVEGALSERFNRTVRGFDGTTVNPLNNQARANYARSPTPELPLDQFVVKGGLLFAGTGGQPHALFDTGKKNFAPRIGFAYQANKDTVVRAGYGIFFGYVGQQRGEKVKQYGYDQTTNLVPTLDNGLTFAATLDNPFPGGLLSPVGAANGLNTYLGNSISFFNTRPLTPYNQRWQLSVQRTLAEKFLVEVGYVGNRAVRLETSLDLRPFDARYYSRSPVRDQAAIDYWTARLANPFYPLLPGTGLAASVLQRDAIVRMQQFPQFTGVSATDNQGYSWYHALEARMEKRFSSGYTLQLAYTWSKMMEALSRLNGQLSPLEEVISSQDRPHRFVASGIYELPFGPGKLVPLDHPFWKRVAGGWQTQAVYIGQSGPALGFGNALITGNFSEIELAKGQRTVDQWFNTAPFNKVSAEQLSYNYRTVSSRFNGIRADGRNVWNLSLFKNTQIWERVTLQIRGELFNAFNHAQFGAPNTTPTSAAFGAITGTTMNPRLVQLGLKLAW